MATLGHRRAVCARVFCTGFMLLTACGHDESPTSPSVPIVGGPASLISDGVNSGGLQGFYWVPPIAKKVKYVGISDPDLVGLDPVVTIRVCSGDNCPSVGATVAQFTRTSTPAITYNSSIPQYQVSWSTQGYSLGTYRIEVAAGATGFRRILGQADVKLTATAKQAKSATTTQQIGLQVGSPLAINFRIETRIAGSVTISPTTATISPGGSQQFTATLRDLHGALLSGKTVRWLSISSPATGVIASVTPISGTTNGSGQAETTVTAGSTPGTATVYVISSDQASPNNLLFATASLLVTEADPGDFWTTEAAMPTARGYMGTTALNGALYVVGGTVTGSLANVEAYDPGTNMWTTKAPLPAPRGSLGAAAINGTLYAVGGQGFGPYLSTLEAYDPGSNAWSSRAPMPTARAFMGVAAINGTLYVAGGAGNIEPNLTTLEAYDPVSNTWNTMAPMPTGRNSVGAAALNGILYVVGGSANSEPVATVEAYNPATDSWTTKAPMPAARHSPAVAAVNGILYAVGGASEGASSVATVYAYDPVSNTWSTKASMPTARYAPGADALNGILYAIGGFNYDLVPDGGLITLEAYHP